MKKTNWGLILIVIILSVLVGGLGGYIIHDKLAEVENTDTKVNNILSNDDALMIAKTQVEKYFDFYHALGVYCGEGNIYDKLEFGSYENNDFRDYWASNTFSSIDSVKKYYKTFMVEELYPEYLNDENSYLEQNDKLYCRLSHKGCADSYNVESSQYLITSVTEDMIVVDVKLVSDTCGDAQNVRTGTVKLVRGSEATWLVSEYNVFIGNE